MTSIVTLVVGAEDLFIVEGGIGDYEVEEGGGAEIGNVSVGDIGLEDGNLVGEGGLGYVGGCLLDGRWVYVDAEDVERGISLSNHKCKYACSCADVESILFVFDIAPSTKENSISAHLHRTFVLMYDELLKLEPRIGHIRTVSYRMDDVITYQHYQ